VENFINEVSKNGLWLEDAQERLVDEFDQIDINQHQIIVCGASVGTGKTHNAIRKVKEAVGNNINVLILVPTHALASEWETRLDLGETKSVVRLHGISSPEVNCPNKSEADQLMSKGHSTLFRQKYCHSCEQRDQCKHFQSLDQAADSNILIAQHKHLNMFPQFLRNQHNNHDRTLLMIDEMPELVNLEKISSDDIETNLNLFQQINQQADNAEFSDLIEILTEIGQAYDARTDFDLSDHIIQQLRHLDFGQLNEVLASHYLTSGKKPQHNNLLWHLMNIGILKKKLVYRKDEDVMTYRWTPNFNDKTTFILSGTLKSEYIEKQINQSVVGMAQAWMILRNNLKIVQLVTSMNGRKSLEKAINSGE
ncbi:MAG: DEAD/DEAH box helicase family protein, partial [Candidatus Poribacteria bacterium]|nr:DEAD/DEAH box helicase family protein [Candidatus Poribacteria bacterium]